MFYVIPNPDGNTGTIHITQNDGSTYSWVTVRDPETANVQYTQQTLTEAQKQQARNNIDAASLADIENLDYVTAATLPTASAETMGHVYLIGPDASNNYQRYYTQQNGSSYSWVDLGSTQLDLSTYATEAEVIQLEAKVYVEDKLPIPITETGYYIKTSNGVGNHIGGKTESGSYSYMRYPVAPGDIIIVNGTGGASPRLWCFIDENEIILAAAEASTTESNQQHIAPANSAEVIINTNNTSVPSYHLTRELTSTRVVELNADVIKGWILSESFTATSVTRDADGNVSAVSVVWPDGETGTITITRDSDGNATSVVATHDGTSYTLTITRDSEGNVTSTSIL